MEKFFTLELFGWVAAGLSMFSLMPQAILTLRTKNTEGLSLPGFALIFSSIVSWFIYGVAIGDYPLIFTNIVSMTTSGIIFFVLLHQRVPVMLARIKNRSAAADIAVVAEDGLPPVSGFPDKPRFIRPRRRRSK